MLRAYTRRKQFEAKLLARAVVEALADAMQSAEGGAAAAAPAASAPAASDTVPAGRLLAMMGVSF